jgi:glycosyltransferase involved in cell wall biosynthesis
MTREDALSLMESAHLMLITSLRDLTSTVTVEGLALGLPIVCPDHCGFSDAITEDCGFRVSTDSPDAMVEGLAKSLGDLCRDEVLRQRLAEGALVRSQQYGWGRKGKLMDEVYRARHKEHLEEPAGEMFL